MSKEKKVWGKEESRKKDELTAFLWINQNLIDIKSHNNLIHSMIAWICVFGVSSLLISIITLLVVIFKI